MVFFIENLPSNLSHSYLTGKNLLRQLNIEYEKGPEVASGPYKNHLVIG